MFDKAVQALSIYMWNRGKTNLQIPIENIHEPLKQWGARECDEEHVKVYNFINFNNFY